MTKHFCCSFSLKTGAYIVALINLIGGFGELCGGIVKLTYNQTDEGNTTFYVVCVFLGISTLSGGLLLTYGTIQGKEMHIFCYILIGSTNLMILTIYCGINMFEMNVLFVLFAACPFLWYFQFAVYNFYEEVREYNTVNSGVIEIAYNANAYENSVALEQEAVENTPV